MKIKEYLKLIDSETSDEMREFLLTATDEEKLAKGHELLDAIENNLNRMFDAINNSQEI